MIFEEWHTDDTDITDHHRYLSGEYNQYHKKVVIE